MELDHTHRSYRASMRSLKRCFAERKRLIDEFQKAIDRKDQNQAENVAELLESVHQIQHKSFDTLGILSRHYLHVLDPGSALDIFNNLSRTKIALRRRKDAGATLKKVIDKADHTGEESKQWLYEELVKITKLNKEDFLGLIMGSVMLIISENFHRIVEEHREISETVIPMIELAQGTFPDGKVIPSDYILMLNPTESKRTAEEALREYTVKFLDPESHKAYH